MPGDEKASSDLRLVMPLGRVSVNVDSIAVEYWTPSGRGDGHEEMRLMTERSEQERNRADN
jgi:hypothetical protein